MVFKDWQQNARLTYYIGLSLHNCLKKPGKKKGLHTPHKLNFECCQIIREAKDSALHTVSLVVISLDSDKVIIVKLFGGLLTQHTLPMQRREDTLKPGFSRWGLRVSLDCRKVLLVFTHVMRRPFWVPNKRIYLYRICMKIALSSLKAQTVVMRHKNGYRDIRGKPIISSLLKTNLFLDIAELHLKRFNAVVDCT